MIFVPGIMLAAARHPRPTNSRDAMKVLIFLMESFIGAFGITKPKPEQQRTVALLLGGFLLLFFAGLISLIAWMLSSGQR